MDEYLFRGKRVDNVQWWYGDLISEVDVNLSVNKAYVHNRLSSINFNGNCMGAIVVLIEVDPETIGQFTGRLDMNKNKIFKGDKVIIRDDSDEIGVVVWDNEESEWGIDTETAQLKLGCYYDKEIEIVGDIYD